MEGTESETTSSSSQSDTDEPSIMSRDSVNQIEMEEVIEELVLEYSAEDLLEGMIENLKEEYDTSFLSAYLEVLKTKKVATINLVTAKIMASMETEIRKERVKEVALVLVAWLSAAMLWRAPQVPPAHSALLAVLPDLPVDQTDRIAAMWWSLVSPSALLLLSDAAPRSPYGEHMLRAALSRLQRHDATPKWKVVTPDEAAKTFEEIKLLHTWDEMHGKTRRGQVLLLVLRVWARARAMVGQGDPPNGLGSSASAYYELDVQRIELAISKLQNMYGNNQELDYNQSGIEPGPGPSVEPELSAEPGPSAKSKPSTEPMEIIVIDDD